MTRPAFERLRALTRGPLRPAERWCLAAAAVCFAWVGWVWLDGALWQQRQMSRLEASAGAVPATAVTGGEAVPTSAIPSRLPPVELGGEGPRWKRAATEAAEDATGRTPNPPAEETAGDAGDLPAGDARHGAAGRPSAPVAAGAAPALPGETVPASPTPSPPPPTAPAALAELSVPRLGLSWAVAEGVAAGTLRRAPGWIPGTARPGTPGNVGIAGHRDGVFRPLEGAARDDLVVFETPAGRFRYRVKSVAVVPPGATHLLAPTAEPTLTLITCYPFTFLGPAPDRFVVRAERLGPG